MQKYYLMPKALNEKYLLFGIEKFYLLIHYTFIFLQPTSFLSVLFLFLKFYDYFMYFGLYNK